MTVQDIISALGLEVAAGADGVDTNVTGGYASDLLSCVMAKAAVGNVWVTLQSHVNVVAVASLLSLACVVITEGARPDDEMVSRANENGVPILLTASSTFAVVGALDRLGISG